MQPHFWLRKEPAEVIPKDLGPIQQLYICTFDVSSCSVLCSLQFHVHNSRLRGQWTTTSHHLFLYHKWVQSDFDIFKCLKQNINKRRINKIQISVLIKFYWNTALPIHLQCSIPAFLPPWQSWVGLTGIFNAPKPKISIFTIQPIMKSASFCFRLTASSEPLTL